MDVRIFQRGCWLRRAFTCWRRRAQARPSPSTSAISQPPAEAATTATPAELAGAGPSTQLRRILIVEDETSAANAIRDALEMESNGQWEVRIALSGEEALALLASQPVDLVLLDVRLPGMSGAEVLRRLRDAPETSRLPVIFLSGATSFDLSLEGIQEGILLRKPFQLADLLAMVKANLPPRGDAPGV